MAWKQTAVGKTVQIWAIWAAEKGVETQHWRKSVLFFWPCRHEMVGEFRLRL